ncbi:cryptic protein-like [Narcine bancroftii]|uniref:cryptic protein-like n=1 Tax=Narcine bancroftii TaxID=1343680 RepID=UPI0038312434
MVSGVIKACYCHSLEYQDDGDCLKPYANDGLLQLTLLAALSRAAGSVDGCGAEGDCGRETSAANPEKPIGRSPVSLSEFNQLKNKRGEPRSSAAAGIVRFVGLTDSKTLDRSCCSNGGTCILGSFCACPPPFIGRYCELDERLKRCGKFLDGQWVLKQCTWCKCSYGNFYCLETFGRVENCVPDQNDDLGEYYGIITSDGSSLLSTQYLLSSVLCFVVILGL